MPGRLELLDEPADAEVRRRRGRRRELVGGRAQVDRLHIGILVGAEQVLQPLQPFDERLAIVGRQQAGEALQEVAQLLGVLAHVVDVLGGCRRGDRSAVVEQCALGLADAIGDDCPDRVSAARPAAVRVHRARQQRRPVVEELADVAAAEAAGQLVVGAGAVGDDLAAQRLEVVAGLVAVERGDPLVPFDDLHVEVTRRAGEVAEGPHRRLGPGQHVGSEDGAAVAQDRTGAPHGDAQVVQELRVEIVEGAGQVDLDGRGEVGQHEAEPLDRRQVAVEGDARVDVPAPAVDAGDRQRDVDDVAVVRRTDMGGDELERIGSLSLVAGQRVDADEPAADDLVTNRDALLDGDGGDHLVIAVAALGTTRGGRQRGDGEHGADLGDVGEAGPQRSGRQLGREARGDHRGQRRHRCARPGQHEGVGAVLEAQTGLVQAAVERVEHGGRQRRRRTDDEAGADQVPQEGVGHLRGAAARDGRGHGPDTVAPVPRSLIVCSLEDSLGAHTGHRGHRDRAEVPRRRRARRRCARRRRAVPPGLPGR